MLTNGCDGCDTTCNRVLTKKDKFESISWDRRMGEAKEFFILEIEKQWQKKMMASAVNWRHTIGSYY